jgi:HEAT repeat protein
LVLSRHPPPEALTRAAASAPPDAAVVLLHQLGGRDDALARVVRRSALRHPDGSVRARSLETMSAAARAEAVAELRQLTMDPDEAVRGAALLCCVELRDRGVIPRLSALLDGRLGARSAQQAATALGHLGGMDGAIALRRAFLTSRHAEVKAACAIALAEIGDESARAMIEKEAARFLHRGSLKAACVEALRRLDARRGGH